MCDELHLRYDIVAKHNHKLVSMKIIHYFLNKAQSITSNNCDTMGCFVETGINIVYAWNSTPIDCTNTICSISAIELELRSPLDIELQKEVTLISNSANSTLDYLRLTHVDRSFATSIL